MPREESTARGGLRTFVRENSLSLFFFAIFLAALLGQAVPGPGGFNAGQLDPQSPGLHFLPYPSPFPFPPAVTRQLQAG